MLNKKFIILEACAAIVFVLFICLVSNKPVKDVSINEIMEGISISEETEAFIKSNAQGLRKYYGLSSVDIEEFILFLPASNMDASELLIIKMKDESKGEEIKKAIETRLKNKKNAFESYGVDQMKLLNNASLCIEGKYALFMVGEDSKNVEKDFKKAIR